MSSKLSLIAEQDQEPWYKEGLRFKCTECGKCCTGAPGYVWVNREEITEMATYLKITVKEFSRLYLRSIHGKLSLKEKPHTYDCIFLKNQKCQLYSKRPVQCRTFPWWPSQLKNKEAWLEAAQHCEGICEEAPVVDRAHIEKELKIQESYIANNP